MSAQPVMLEWRLPSSGVVLTSLLGRPPAAPELKVRSERAICRLFVPRGADAWRRCGTAPWLPLADLPLAWGLRPLAREDVPVYDEEEDEFWLRRRKRC